MSPIIIGFGSTEKERESVAIDHLEKGIREILKERIKKMDCIESDDQNKIREFVEKNANASQKTYNRLHNEGTRPERYGQYYATCTFSSCDCCVVLNFHHINSQHPFSPDGVAMMSTTRFAHVCTLG
jgi:predicted metal-binding protein